MASVFRVLRMPVLLQPQNATLVIMTCVYLHNFLRKSSLSYAPHEILDTAEALHSVDTTVGIEGEMTSFIPFRPIARRASNFAENVRHIFTQYVNYAHKLPWQESHSSCIRDAEDPTSMVDLCTFQLIRWFSPVTTPYQTPNSQKDPTSSSTVYTERTRQMTDLSYAEAVSTDRTSLPSERLLALSAGPLPNINFRSSCRVYTGRSNEHSLVRQCSLAQVSEEIWEAVNTEAFRADKVKRGEWGAAPVCKGRGEREIPDKTRRTSGIVRHDSHKGKSESDPHRESNPVRLGRRRILAPVRSTAQMLYCTFPRAGLASTTGGIDRAKVSILGTRLSARAVTIKQTCFVPLLRRRQLMGLACWSEQLSIARPFLAVILSVCAVQPWDVHGPESSGLKIADKFRSDDAGPLSYAGSGPMDGGKKPGQLRLDGGKTPDLRRLDGGKTPA
ncbi:hypothetical protein PR048_030337 [Dryococelus australis]|uniref:Uncharacterized protein n=1 Tax=Dryococelus australis TaxID=614101 RepID=A0ABQ9GBE9_9NEOP|nr:hypothetical protein PR048_030337 [Dryococelus australis]